VNKSINLFLLPTDNSATHPQLAKTLKKFLANPGEERESACHGVFLGNDVKTKKQSRPYFA
jgi:hypothetical protein